MFIFDPSLVPACPANGLWSHKHVFGSEKLTPRELESHASLLNACLFSRLPQAKAFYSYWTEPATIRNLKRGLASLLQVQLKSGKVVEVNVTAKPLSVCVFNLFSKKSVNSWNAWEQNDVSGRCTVAYQAEKHRVTRTKLLETCKTAETCFTTHSKVSSPAEPADVGMSLAVPGTLCASFSRC